MDFLQPTSWADALAARAERPDAVAIAGGTDVMVDLNFDRRRPEVVLDLTRVPELADWSRSDGAVRVGAGFIVYVLIKVFRGRWREPSVLLWIIALLFVIYFAIDPVERLLGV